MDRLCAHVTQLTRALKLQERVDPYQAVDLLLLAGKGRWKRHRA